MLELTPRIYGKNMTWKIAPNNIITVVNSQPMLNTISDATENVKSLQYTEVISPFTNSKIPLYENGISFGLAMAAYPELLHIDIAYSDRINAQQQNHIAAGRTEVYRCTIDDEITLDSPIYDTPIIEVQLNGNSYYRQSAKQTTDYDNGTSSTLKRFATIQDPTAYLWADAYEKEKLVHQENQMYFMQDQSSNNLSCIPFISTSGINTSRVTQTNVSSRQESDYLSAWIADKYPGESATTDSWQQIIYEKGVNVSIDTNNKNLYYPYNYEDIDIDTYPNTPLKLYADVQKLVQVTLTDTDNPLKKLLHIDFPIYVGGSYRACLIALGPRWVVQATDIIDYVTSVTVNILARKFSTDTEDKSYTLDAENNLTTEITSNKHSYSITNNELITTYTKIDSTNWNEAISQLLLDKYKEGKYIVKAQVPAQWALANNVHINTQMYIKTLNGEYISRKEVNCIFEVKIIKKHFESSQFYYELQLMEA
jgi:hypothetical protein